jgi:HD-like signal output (HDOD) protein
MGQQTIHSLIEESFETDSEALPVFSPIALQLQRLKSREDSSMAQVTALIMKDQSLAGRVLQVANSSFYGGLKKVETVSHAVVRLGIERVANLAMMASQAAAHQASHPLIANYLPLLWQRSFASALGSRWVAQRSFIKPAQRRHSSPTCSTTSASFSCSRSWSVAATIESNRWPSRGSSSTRCSRRCMPISAVA